MFDLNKLAAEIHAAAVEKGFWDVEDAESKHIAKMISELGEIVQADRAGVMYEVEHDGAKPEGVIAEIADFVMMTLDLAMHDDMMDVIKDGINDAEKDMEYALTHRKDVHTLDELKKLYASSPRVPPGDLIYELCIRSIGLCKPFIFEDKLL